ncbi:hypothetical protein RPC_2878 [Rhodopseudomonas palustris BisB18]|uniref:Lipoprotein n=1 Tax=Rhodopseudomonas palustris (strain BisB18) TaxID=316056 RepID=Q213L0_RHOPB
MAVTLPKRALAFAAALLPLLGCASVSREPRVNELGVELHSISRDEGLGMSLAACTAGGQLDRYVDNARAGANSWYEVVRTIDQCNIDAARYYTSPETMSRIIVPLDTLVRVGTPDCRDNASVLRQRILATNREIVGLVGALTSLCQTTDSLSDMGLQKRRLRQQRADICRRIGRALGGSSGDGCRSD